MRGGGEGVFWDLVVWEVGWEGVGVVFLRFFSAERCAHGFGCDVLLVVYFVNFHLLISFGCRFLVCGDGGGGSVVLGVISVETGGWLRLFAWSLPHVYLVFFLF